LPVSFSRPLFLSLRHFQRDHAAYAQDNQLMSKQLVLSFKPQLQLEWRGQDGQNETEQPDHSAA